MFGTPHGADIAALCAGYGVRHTRVGDVDGLLPALAAPGPGLSVVEVRVDRAGRRALGERLAAQVAAAVGARAAGLRSASIHVKLAANSQVLRRVPPARPCVVVLDQGGHTP